mmetsp:Transcript_17683/g.45217  ORF Transcript_17683/g.45217 Transcript_17683/m.45217 type:complete len:211 (-) Transcript_17683:45-677(-)
MPTGGLLCLVHEGLLRRLPGDPHVRRMRCSALPRVQRRARVHRRAPSTARDQAHTFNSGAEQSGPATGPGRSRRASSGEGVDGGGGDGGGGGWRDGRRTVADVRVHAAPEARGVQAITGEMRRSDGRRLRRGWELRGCAPQRPLVLRLERRGAAAKEDLCVNARVVAVVVNMKIGLTGHFIGLQKFSGNRTHGQIEAFIRNHKMRIFPSR